MSKLFEEMLQVFGFGGDDVMGTRRAGFNQRKEERRQKALKRAELMSASSSTTGKVKANTAVTVFLPKVEEVKKINLTEFQVGIYKEYGSLVKDAQRKYEVTKLINNNNKDSKEIDDSSYGRIDWSQWTSMWE